MSTEEVDMFTYVLKNIVGFNVSIQINPVLNEDLSVIYLTVDNRPSVLFCYNRACDTTINKRKYSLAILELEAYESFIRDRSKNGFSFSRYALLIIKLDELMENNEFQGIVEKNRYGDEIVFRYKYDKLYDTLKNTIDSSTSDIL